jgi:hypothetical protein
MVGSADVGRSATSAYLAWAVLVVPNLEDVAADPSKELLCRLLATLGPSPASARICRLEHGTSPTWVCYAPLVRWDLHEELCSEEGVSSEVAQCYLLLSCQRRVLHGHLVVEVTVRTPNVLLLPAIRTCLLIRFHKLEWVVVASPTSPIRDLPSLPASSSSSSSSSSSLTSFLISAAATPSETWGSIAASLLGEGPESLSAVKRSLGEAEALQARLARVSDMGVEEGEAETKRLLIEVRELYGAMHFRHPPP